MPKSYNFLRSWWKSSCCSTPNSSLWNKGYITYKCRVHGRRVSVSEKVYSTTENYWCCWYIHHWTKVMWFSCDCSKPKFQMPKNISFQHSNLNIGQHYIYRFQVFNTNQNEYKSFHGFSWLEIKCIWCMYSIAIYWYIICLASHAMTEK